MGVISPIQQRLRQSLILAMDGDGAEPPPPPYHTPDVCPMAAAAAGYRRPHRIRSGRSSNGAYQFQLPGELFFGDIL